MRNETLERIISILGNFINGNPENYYILLEYYTEKYSLTENEIYYIEDYLFS